MTEAAKILAAVAEVKVEVGNIKHTLEEVHVAIYGDNGDGLKVKVDRNTEFRKHCRWGLTTLIGLAVLVTAILALVL